MSEPVEPVDPQRLYEALEAVILGSARTLTRGQVAEAAGVPLERAVALWRALGFPGAGSDDDVLFVDADVEALRLVGWLVESGFVPLEAETTLVRSMGRSFARLAEWETAELTSAARSGAMAAADQERLEELMVSLVPVVEDIQNYIWRRHLANAAGRILLRPAGDGERRGVGFADIVGFTRRSRGLSTRELTALVESFESVSASTVTEHGGRVIKTIGDEVLFVADTPEDLARTALALVEATGQHEDFPEIRVGAAYGEVLSRLGDVFGPVVNVASRLTSLARPGRVLVDRDLSVALAGRPTEFRVRRGRTTTVKGYARLDTWTLTRPRTSDPG